MYFASKKRLIINLSERAHSLSLLIKYTVHCTLYHNRFQNIIVLDFELYNGFYMIKSLMAITIRLSYKSGNVLLFQGVSTQVSSAPESLTSVFGMGTGVSSPLLPPETLYKLQISFLYPQNCIMLRS